MPVLEVVEFVHLEGEVLVSNFKLSDALVVRFDLLIEPHLLLMHDSLFRLQLVCLV